MFQHCCEIRRCSWGWFAAYVSIFFSGIILRQRGFNTHQWTERRYACSSSSAATDACSNELHTLSEQRSTQCFLSRKIRSKVGASYWAEISRTEKRSCSNWRCSADAVLIDDTLLSAASEMWFPGELPASPSRILVGFRSSYKYHALDVRWELRWCCGRSLRLAHSWAAGTDAAEHPRLLIRPWP